MQAQKGHANQRIAIILGCGHHSAAEWRFLCVRLHRDDNGRGATIVLCCGRGAWRRGLEVERGCEKETGVRSAVEVEGKWKWKEWYG